MKASVLSIGTELTTGQIFNKNAQWISEKLYSFGIETLNHFTVPDDKKIILNSLKFVENEVQLLFVTGGLGPTTDDFTREVLAEWANSKLVFDDNSWKHIESVLTPRGIPIREMQKQQCYFPEGARILTNSAGTANGFSFQKGPVLVYVFPGPPREIDAIWKDFIHADLQKLTANLDAHMTLSWDTIGLGESEIAHKTERALASSPIEKGYRVHLPYVEVKLSFKKSEFEKYKKDIAAVDAALTEWTVITNQENFIEKLFSSLAKVEQICFIDEVTEGFFFNRFKDSIKSLSSKSEFTYSTSHLEKPDLGADSFFLKLERSDTAHAKLTLRHESFKKEILITAPFDKPALHERKLQYIAEIALLEAYKVFKGPS